MNKKRFERWKKEQEEKRQMRHRIAKSGVDFEEAADALYGALFEGKPVDDEYASKIMGTASMIFENEGRNGGFGK